MSKSERPVKFAFTVFAFTLFLQGLGIISFIPIKFITNFLNVTNDPLSLFISAFYAIIFVFIASAFVDVFYSFGFKRNGVALNQKRIFAQGFIVFFTIWVTFFSYGIFAVFGILPKIVAPDQILSFYLCWYILFNLFTKTTPKKSVRGEIIGNSKNLEIDVDRVTWWSHITRLNTAQEFNGKKDKIIFRQKKRTFFFLFIFIMALWMISPILRILSSFLFLPVNPPELASFIRIIVGFFLFVSNVPLVAILGIISSRGITVYKNCISLPLATFSDIPLFTLLLPRSLVILGFDDIESYQIEKKEYKQSDEQYISSITFIMKNKDYYVFKPSVPLSFEQTLISAIGEEKIIS